MTGIADLEWTGGPVPREYYGRLTHSSRHADAQDRHTKTHKYKHRHARVSECAQVHR